MDWRTSEIANADSAIRRARAVCRYVCGMNRPEGSSWWKVDFHAHSPESFDFGGVEGQRSSSSISMREWLTAYMQAEVDIVVIADHNTSAGIEPARAELSLMRDEPAAGFREITLFAGVELTVNGGYHLLAVFGHDTDAGAVDRLLERCNYRGDRGDSNGTTEFSLEQSIREITQDGGIAIPAHVETRGYLALDERSRSAIETAHLVVAAEATTPDGIAEIRDRGWTAVLGSDAHHLDGTTAPANVEAKFPGSHFTWIKMQVPNLHGLKLALADPESSVRTSDHASQDPNEVAHSLIRQISVRRGNSESLQEISPWMTAIIGGRGVGKSTLLELLRLAMGRFEELPERLQNDQIWFSPDPPRGGEERYWDEVTVVTIEYEKLGQRFRVEWSGATGEATVKVFHDDEWVADPGSPRDRFPILMYSQKQIYETAQDPQSLLRMIDEQPAIDYANWSTDFDALVADYRTKRAELRQLDGTIESEGRLCGELADVSAELTIVEALLDSPDLAELNRLLARAQAEDDLERRAGEFEEVLAQALDAIAPLDEQGEQPQEGDGSEAAEEPIEAAQGDALSWPPLAAREAAFETAVGLVREAVAELTDAREARENADVEESPLILRIAELRSAITMATDDDADDPSTRHRELKDRKMGVERALVAVGNAKTKHGELSAVADELLRQVQAHRHELTKRRTEYLASISKPDLRLNLYEWADEDSLEADLRRVLNKPSSFDGAFAKGSGLRLSLPHPQSNSYQKSIEELKAALKELRKSGASAAQVQSGWIGNIEGRFYSHVSGLDQYDFDLEVDLWFPEDRLQLRYSQGGALQNLEQGSPGQKTAALLAVILQLNDVPLILDQPEDDLDNKLISDLVVKTLKKTKTQRQVIVVTHNANLVVNGDAELVVVMQSNLPVPLVEASGSIQDATVKDAVCLILEGGEEAFSARYRRLIAAGINA